MHYFLYCIVRQLRNNEAELQLLLMKNFDVTKERLLDNFTV